MKYILDTNICIYYLKGLNEKVRNNLLTKHPDDIKIPAIVKAELLYGAEKSKKKQENLEKIMEFLLPYEITPFSDNMTHIYAKIRVELEKKGNIIGPHDLLIAATVLQNNDILVTNNIREFKKVKGLKLENWI